MASSSQQAHAQGAHRQENGGRLHHECAHTTDTRCPLPHISVKAFAPPSPLSRSNVRLSKCTRVLPVTRSRL
eukprot:4988531-Pyramimonas_sp.AAC.1